MRAWSELVGWVRGPASKPWLVAYMAVLAGITWFGASENRERINDLCQVIVIAYSQSALTDIELTPVQQRVLGPVFQQLAANSALNRARVLRAADCELPGGTP